LLEKWNDIFIEGQIDKRLSTPTQAVRMTKIHFKTKRRGKGKLHYLVEDNPFDLTLLRSRPIKKQKEKESISHLLGLDDTLSP
jgi:hypothetical protein